MKSFPFVSVIMPIRNESDFIARSLGGVLTQDYPHDRMEVLVADGLSSDNTREIVRGLADHSDVPIILVDNPGQIVPTGFNTALKQARGEVIVRVDGHTIIEHDYITCCVEALYRSGADNVGGKMNAVGRGALSQAIALATSSSFGVGGARFHYSNKEEFVDTVYMGAWRREVFERIGCFDEEMVRNQDDEFNYRLRSHGGKILLSPTISIQILRTQHDQEFGASVLPVWLLQGPCDSEASPPDASASIRAAAPGQCPWSEYLVGCSSSEIPVVTRTGFRRLWVW